MNKLSFFMPILLVVSSCTTVPLIEPDAPKRRSAPRSQHRPRASMPDERVDLNQLQKVLRMDRDQRNLGLKVKKFNTCKVGSGYTKNRYCRQKYLSVVHFRIRCRASTGTVEEVSHTELMPMTSRLQWMLAGQIGRIRTDYEGFGQIIIVTNFNPRNNRLILRGHENNLGLRLNGVSHIMVPSDWCH